MPKSIKFGLSRREKRQNGIDRKWRFTVSQKARDISYWVPLYRQTMHERDEGSGGDRCFQVKIHAHILPIVTMPALG